MYTTPHQAHGGAGGRLAWSGWRDAAGGKPSSAAHRRRGGGGAAGRRTVSWQGNTRRAASSAGHHGADLLTNTKPRVRAARSWGAAGSRAGPYLETAPAAPAARPAATRGALPASGRARRGGGGRRRARPALPRCGCTCGPGSAARSAAALFAGGRGAAPRAERRPLAAASGS